MGRASLGGSRHDVCHPDAGGPPLGEGKVAVYGSRFARRWALVATMAVLLSSCGGGGGGSGGGGGVAFGGGSKVGAQQWIKSACTSIGTWVRDIQKRVSGVTSQTPNSAEEGKKAITDFFEAVIADTGRLVDELRAAGTPDVDNGDQIETAILTALGNAKSALEQARTRVEGLPTNNPQAFLKAIQTMSQAVQGAFQKAGQQFSNLRSPELEAAAAKEPACKAITAA
jgi:predicted lipid-binding transport protein (Tim44 family)